MLKNMAFGCQFQKYLSTTIQNSFHAPITGFFLIWQDSLHPEFDTGFNSQGLGAYSGCASGFKNA